MKKTFVYLFLTLLLGSSYIFSQDHSEPVNSGIDQYQNGDYDGAVNSFTEAINNKTSSESDVPLTHVSKETDVTVNNESDVKTSKEDYVGVSKEEYTGDSKEEDVGISPEKYINDPLEHQGSDDAQLYMYRGRALMQTGDFEEAFNDFDKAVEMDPSFSEAYFRRALANHKLDSDEVCNDLEKAKEMGHTSANDLYNQLCK